MVAQVIVVVADEDVEDQAGEQLLVVGFDALRVGRTGG
jgi:hypothetical protein